MPCDTLLGWTNKTSKRGSCNQLCNEYWLLQITSSPICIKFSIMYETHCLLITHPSSSLWKDPHHSSACEYSRVSSLASAGKVSREPSHDGERWETAVFAGCSPMSSGCQDMNERYYMTKEKRALSDWSITHFLFAQPMGGCWQKQSVRSLWL